MTRIMLALSLVCLLPSAAAQASVTVTGPLTHDHRAATGQLIEGSIPLANGGEEPVRVRLSLRDYTFQADGSNAYAPPGSHPRSSGRWIRLDREELVLPPGEKSSVRYSMRIPEKLPAPGSYWSVVLVEPAPRTPDPSATEGEIRVATVMRYAVQIATRIGEAEPELSFTGVQAVPGEGGVHVQVDLANEGQRHSSPSTWIELFDPGGASMGRLDAGRKRIYPSCSARFDAMLPQLPAQTYTALVVADDGDDHVVGTRLVLEVE